MTNPAGTRARLLDAAMQLFWEKGYGSTSIQDVLLKVGVHAGSLYHFFPAKQDLLVAVLERYRDGLRPVLLEPAWAKVDDPIERIFALLGSYRSSPPIASMAAPSGRWRSSSTSPIPRCVSSWPGISPAGPRRWNPAWQMPGQGYPGTSTTPGSPPLFLP